ncbi:alpha/beta fold hydrolase [Acidimangrovimonas sediminis]|uniref:alpha/beta fold hydrolase n=1 Tax=Acidimangrovimonas sediminis TaxID=2056283 RepID=UPI001304C8A0|nr:alpha/beta fold hydrolase [Acidimangrovimonas sediminis]
MGRILLVHGAWGTGAIWDRVAPRLSEAGHEVTAVTLPGHGGENGGENGGVHDPGAIGLDDYVAHVAALAVAGPPALLVGHSMGGMVISGVAQAVPQAVRKLVYVAALLPADGQSLIDLIRSQDSPGVARAVRKGARPGTSEIDPELAAPIFFPEATPEEAASVTYVAQPNRGQTEAIRLGPAFDSVPRAYVHARHDQVVTFALQQQMRARTPCAEVFTLDCGHFPQLTRPEELAAILGGL